MSQKDATVTRYVITHMGKDGLRTLIGPAQGRFTYATRKEAEARLAELIEGNAPSRIDEVYGRPLEVRACECWAGHHDPVGVYFEETTP